VVDTAKVAELRKKYCISVRNPISTLRILGNFEAALLLLTNGRAMASYYAISTGASSAFASIYGFDELQVSYCFLAIEVESIISTYTTGKLVDWNYRCHAKRLNFPVTKNRATDLTNFPIEKVCLELCLPCLVLAGGGIIAHGFLMGHNVLLAGAIIMLFLLGYALVAGFQILQVLLVDLYPPQCGCFECVTLLVRCCGVCRDHTDEKCDGVRTGVYYVGAAVYGIFPGPVFRVKYGMQWRKAKREREASKRMLELAKGEQVLQP
jgi:hypothetical protein